MAETAVASSSAAVLTFDKQENKWVPEGPGKGLAMVKVYKHNEKLSYRVVARNLADKQIISINTMLSKNTKYHIATPTFHQWRDSRKVYGLSFPSEDSANAFANTTQSCVQELVAAAAEAANYGPANPQPPTPPQQPSQQQQQQQRQQQAPPQPPAPAAPPPPAPNASDNTNGNNNEPPTATPSRGGLLEQIKRGQTLRKTDSPAAKDRSSTAVSSVASSNQAPAEPKAPTTIQEEMQAKLQRRKMMSDESSSAAPVVQPKAEPQDPPKEEQPPPAVPAPAPPQQATTPPKAAPPVASKKKPPPVAKKNGEAPPVMQRKNSVSSKTSSPTALSNGDFDKLKESMMNSIKTRLDGMVDDMMAHVEAELEKIRPQVSNA